jgi:hypothetical protein
MEYLSQIISLLSNPTYRYLAIGVGVIVGLYIFYTYFYAPSTSSSPTLQKKKGKVEVDNNYEESGEDEYIEEDFEDDEEQFLSADEMNRGESLDAMD